MNLKNTALEFLNNASGFLVSIALNSLKSPIFVA